jgi:TRAP transporter TAXI family solute receptor
VSVGAPGSGTELIADRILNAAGIDPRRDITRYALSVTESAGSLKDGKIDALFWSGGLPTAAIRELAATPGLSIDLLPSDAVLPALQRDYGRGLYNLAVIPGATYSGIEGDRGTVGVKNLLVASSQLDVSLVAEILRVIYQNKEALVAAHPEARHLERPISLDDAPAPYHPGAIRYYGTVSR